MTEEAYLEKLDLLDEAEIASVLGQLHVNATAKDLYCNAKLPFAFNYVDRSLEVTHDHDTQSEHGFPRGRHCRSQRLYPPWRWHLRQGSGRGFDAGRGPGTPRLSP